MCSSFVRLLSEVVIDAVDEQNAQRRCCVRYDTSSLTMASSCPDTSCNMTSTLSTFETEASTGPRPTESSHKSSSNEVGRNTKSPVGEPTTELSSMRKMTPTTLPHSSKRNLEMGSLSDSTSSDTSSSTECASKKDQNNQDKTQAKRKKIKKIPTENHLKIRKVIDAGSKWELDLEKVHGLTDEEACIVVSKVARYGNEDTFPDPNGDKFLKLAKEGWKHSRELSRLHKLYPECTDQTCIDGEWVMT